MTTPNIITGDDVNLAVNLTKNSAPFVISGAAVVKARIVSANHYSTYTAEVTQSSSTLGANWSTALVIVVLAATSFNPNIPQGPAQLEIQVDDGGAKLTWFVDVNIIRGNVA